VIKIDSKQQIHMYKTMFKQGSDRQQSSTSKTAKIVWFDIFPCTISPLRVSRCLLHCSSETVHENLLKRPVFALLNVPLRRLYLCCLTVVLYIYCN